MHELIKDIIIEYDEKDNQVFITIEDVEGDIQQIQASVYPSGIFRFSYNHPEDGNKYPYQGLFYKENYKAADDVEKLIIYPILGKGVLSNDPIPFTIK